MGVIKAIDKAFEDMPKRKWDRLYFFFDIHGTILKPNYQYGNTPKDFYPYAKETLQLITNIPYIICILYTCSHPNEIQEYIELFKTFNIHFKYINENPEVETQTNGYGCYDKKPYMNVLFEDKASFNPEIEWLEVFNYFNNKLKNKNT